MIDHSTSASQPLDFALVERMDLLYVSVVKARHLPIVPDTITGRFATFVQVNIGNYKGVTKHINENQDPEWNAVFALSKNQVQASTLDVVVKYKDLFEDEFDIGIVSLDLNSPLAAPQWYGLKDVGELLLAVWTGTQADGAFYDACHFDTCTHFNPKVYHSPQLWYVRLSVIEAHGLISSDWTRRSHCPQVYVKAQIGNQVMSTKTLQTRTLSTVWNEDLLFVVAEPLEGNLIITVGNHVSLGQDEIFGRVIIPLNSVDRRVDDKPAPARWYNLERSIGAYWSFSSRLHLRVCLDGGYHVLDESTQCSSDLRPTAKEACNTPIGVLEVGIREAEHLHPMRTLDGRKTSDTYCVAKYGKKWVRTRTIVDSLCPKYHEVYSWEVFDTATVLTVGVFDNGQFGGKGYKDYRIGKVEIRISALEAGRVYTHVYPLMVLYPSGVKMMGRIHLAIRFTCTSYTKLLYQYSRPLLPNMHYVQPITPMQQETLHRLAVNIVAIQLGKAEPALGREVVEYMSGDSYYSPFWSMRRSKANFYRLISLFSGLLEWREWFEADVCMWKNPITTLLVHILFLILVFFRVFILPTFFLYMFLIMVWNYRYRPRYPPYKNTRISQAENCHPDELGEEFDTFPTSQSLDRLRMRYDRIRSFAGRVQNVGGDVATQGERLLGLVSWQDHYPTAIFGVFCLMVAVVLYVTPLHIVVALGGLYMMRHPRFRSPLPAAPVNFFRRLPDRTETTL